ncbi:hypothetical protein [Rhizobium wenxiniae]|uniref:Lipoprotein n=1 Tax=Rhizobium wenxiniae TaxID=1737357 RepID=A0A7W9Y5P2_9HYPH|nr:hypothetical protein [Rhizobium wenxiniae]MBB6162469.1 hypothetical protein [Rhizobium wenxiniae]GGF98373.1 hypothetical protein GCM10010924_28240 [Rhizobium wenxiniae]
MRLYRILIPSALLLILASCQTMTPEERRAADERACAGYGFRAKTDAMARCLLDIELDRRAQTRSMMERNDQMFWHSPIVVERRVIVHRP